VIAQYTLESVQGESVQGETVDGDSVVDAGWRRAAVRALHPSRGAVGTDVLAAIAAGLASVTVPWELGHNEVPNERRYERVLSTPAYDAWVICWPSGGALDLHDHGGSAGAFSVVAGQLAEATVDGSVTVERTFSPGETTTFNSTRVHAVFNRGNVVATSVHVYSPPLSSMVYYDVDDEGGLVPAGTDAGGWGNRS
jgi:hypothetical protein